MGTNNLTQYWMIGGGIATMSAAVYLIRDGGISGSQIHFLEQTDVEGGSLDGSRSPVPKDQRHAAYVTRGGRMLEEEAYQCLWNLMASIPSLEDPHLSILDETRAFYLTEKTMAKARIVNADGTIADARDLGLSTRDKVDMTWLLSLPEDRIGARRIEDFFAPAFFKSHFWTMWRTTFAFQNWHSAIELKRYFKRFLQEFDRIHTLSGVRRTKYNQYDSIIRPVQRWLEQQGVDVRYETMVEDIDFEGDKTSRRAARLHLDVAGKKETFELGAHDKVIATLGSMTADTSIAGDDTQTVLVRDKKDASWRLWDNIASKFDDFGRPNVFSGNIEESHWKSFTLTMRSSELLDRIARWTHNPPGSGALMTWHESRWLLSIVIPYQPHFYDQLPGTTTLWGYALFNDTKGDYVDKTIGEATGREILDELLGHLKFEEALNERVRRFTTVTHVEMPYIDAQFQRRVPSDRPLVNPEGAENFAFVGQFVEIPEDVVFTVEYSCRGGMHAAYKLAGIDKPIPPIYQALRHPDVAARALKTFVSGKAGEGAPMPDAEAQKSWILTRP